MGGDPEIVERICNSTLPYIFDLSTSLFGNYFVQKLFSVANNEQISKLLNSLKPSMPVLACHKMGTYPFQNIIKNLHLDEHASIISGGLSIDLHSVITNHFGVHVLQKYQHQFSHKSQQFLFDYICGNMKEVATNQQGIVVLKGCIEIGSYEQKKELTSKILNYAKELSLDEYGNYAIQSLIEHTEDKSKVISEIYKNVKGEVSTLCCNKFSSNVIEKVLIFLLQCLSYESPSRRIIISEILESNDFTSILSDKYGNYVIQYLINIVEPSQKPILAKKIKAHMAQFEKEGKLVTTKWKNYVNVLEK